MSQGYHDPRRIAFFGRHLGVIQEKRPVIDVSECLVAIAYDINGKTACGPKFSDANDILYNEFLRQHLLGLDYLRVELYALPRAALALIPDVGRVSVSAIEEAIRIKNSAHQEPHAERPFALPRAAYDALDKFKLERKTL